MSSSADYGQDSIEVLTGIEVVRRRPGMYVGDPRDGSGLRWLLESLVERARDAHLEGRKVSRVRVSMEGQLAEVEDDGEGLPVDVDPRTGLRAAELLMTRLDGAISMLPIANALSSELELEVRRDGYSWHQRYAQGRPSGPMDRGARTERTGTRIRLRADPTIFTTDFDRAAMRGRLEALAAHNPALTFELMCEPITEPNGLAGWLERRRETGGACECSGACISGEAETLSEILSTRAKRGDVDVDVAIAWSSRGYHDVISTVDQRETTSGGTHERGLWRGIVGAIASRDPTFRGGAPRFEIAQRRLAGLRAIVAVRMPWPTFAGSTRDRGLRRLPRDPSAAASPTRSGRIGVESFRQLRKPRWCSEHHPDPPTDGVLNTIPTRPPMVF